MTRVIDIATAGDTSRDVLGNKGAGLVRLRQLGLRVPPAFVITTDACREFLTSGELPPGLDDEIDAALAQLERQRGERLGDPDHPLLLSVRSGAAISMPGMMDTVLDLGITTSTRAALERRHGRAFARDSHRRFLASFGTVVLGVPASAFEARHADADHDVEAFSAIVEEACGRGVLDEPRAQLRLAVEAVFRSWNSPRARSYRALKAIPDDLGTAVVIQSMVFGNLNQRSGTGVVFTRDPNTGEATAYGDFLFCAQGEDVVAGSHATLPVAALGERLPDVWAELAGMLPRLERELGEMLDIEFTVEDGTLWVLQVRSGKRAAAAAVRIAVEMAQEGLIDRAEAVGRVTPEQLERLTRPHLDPAGGHAVAARGLGASPGVARGAVCLSADRVEDVADLGHGTILVRAETSPSDVHGMATADGVLTARGGLVSHAAVVARDLGVPAVVGLAEMEVDEEDGVVRLADLELREGDVITIDGGSGEVVSGLAALVDPEPCAELATLLAWARELGRAVPAGQAGQAPHAGLAGQAAQPA